MRTVRVQGACLTGAEAELVTVEARFETADRSRTEIVLTGLPDPVVRESRGRLTSALKACGLHLPQGRLFLNLAPAGRRKTGEALDLPLALGSAAAVGHLEGRELAGDLFLGELGIDGRLHAVPGGLAAAYAAQAAGLARVVAPGATAREAAFLPGVRAHGVGDLREVLALVAGAPDAPAALTAGDPDTEAREPSDGGTAGTGLDRIRGQAVGKRALAIAAAGGHGLLFVGPPGTGKSLLARELGSLLPPPSPEERLEITRMLSAAGRWPGGLVATRPFRAPHHTTSYAGLIGGGSPPGPGEVTLAHRGVLFLDELPEFRREVLEALRQPLESGWVTLARAGRSAHLPACFQLVAAMNPCPCGFHGHPRTPCRCGQAAVERYRRRISGPLLDRIELRLELAAPSVEQLAEGPPEPGLAAVALRERVREARARSAARGGRPGNGELDADELDQVVPLRGSLRELAETAARRLALSARAVQALRRVARTIADLDGAERVGVRHMAEAMALRAPL